MPLQSPIRNNRLPLLLIFLLVLVFKVAFEAYTGMQAFHSWEDAGLFEYNEKSDFISTTIIGSFIGLLFYFGIGGMIIAFGNSIGLALATWAGTIFADIYSDQMFEGSSDGQTGIHIAVVYVFFLFWVVGGFFAVNSFLKKKSSSAPEQH